MHALESAADALELRQLFGMLDVMPAPRLLDLEPQVGTLALHPGEVLPELAGLDLDLGLRTRGHPGRRQGHALALCDQQIELAAELEQRLLRQQPLLGLRNQLLDQRDVA